EQKATFPFHLREEPSLCNFPSQILPSPKLKTLDHHGITNVGTKLTQDQALKVLLLYCGSTTTASQPVEEKITDKTNYIYEKYFSFESKEDLKKKTYIHGQLVITDSLTDYIIRNKKLTGHVRDTRVFRGEDIGSGHFLVICKIDAYAKWKKISKLTQGQIQEQVYKTEEIDKTINEKQKEYKNFLKNPSEENKESYRQKRNHAKEIVRKAHRESWDGLISTIGNDDKDAEKEKIDEADRKGLDDITLEERTESLKEAKTSPEVITFLQYALEAERHTNRLTTS
ncbi:hypothetical protein ILUMI_11852, partial [Ignelater luminosus]